MGEGLLLGAVALVLRPEMPRSLRDARPLLDGAPSDAHLQVTNPDNLIPSFIEAGVVSISVQPEVVTHLACLDVLTNLDTWDVLSGLSASVAWHLYLMAQPAGLPEAMISGAADEFFGSFLDAWAHDPAAMPADVRAEYLRASREAVPSIVADYRASAHVDVEHDRADRETGNRLRMPVTVLQQDWGPELSSGAAAMWSAWAADLDHRTVTSGHFMAEEAPGEVIAAVRALLAR